MMVFTGKTKKKKSTVCCKIKCERCGKEDYVTFIPDGSRNYYCNDCLSEFNYVNKKGKIKKVHDTKRDRTLYEYICDACGQMKRSAIAPKRVEGKIFCPECYDAQRQEERRKKRKNVVIVDK